MVEGTLTKRNSTSRSHKVSRAEPPAAPRTELLEITVLMGGPSAEREVSLKSGAAVAAALERCGHRVHRADISPTDLSALDVRADLIFIALHGPFGEDGELQAILDERGISYVGSGAEASRCAMNKVAAKKKFIEAGVPTPRYEVATRENLYPLCNTWRGSAVIKPIAQGSSVDTIIAKDALMFRSALSDVVQKYGSALVEEYIKGMEFTVGVLGDTALPVCEIRTPREFYDYTAKYLVDTTEYLFDLSWPSALLEQVQRLSLDAHRSLGCREFSRVDWMVDGQTHQPYALEVNTIPGFTDHSLLPKAAGRIGIGFDQLCQKIVELAMNRVHGEGHGERRV